MARLRCAGVGAALVIAGAGCNCGGANGGGAEPAPGSTATAVVAPASAAPPGPASAGAPGSASASPPAPPPPLDAAPIEEILKEARRGGSRDVKFVTPSEDDAKRYGALVAALARRAADAKAPTAAALAAEAKPPEGFAVKAVTGREDLIAILEDPGKRKGAGAIVLRIGPSRRLLVEAPHTFYDAGTLPLAIAAFDGLRARALLVNTVHRYAATSYKAPGDEEAGGSVSDVAHAAVSHFQSAHEALVDLDAGLFTLQLHGFGNETASGVDVVVSAARTSLDVAPLVTKLREALSPAVVKAYPDDIQKLGGTTNVQASASRKRGARFLHVEISRAQRDKLEKSPAPLVDALRAAMPDEGGR